MAGSAPDLLEGSPLSPHDEAILEAGKALIVESVETGRELCKFMIGVATGAVPIYVGLLNLIKPKEYVFSGVERVLVVLPAALFVISALIFAAGFYPTMKRFSLDVIEEVERVRTESIRRRRLFAITGFVVLVIGMAFAVHVSLIVMPLR